MLRKSAAFKPGPVKLAALLMKPCPAEAGHYAPCIVPTYARPFTVFLHLEWAFAAHIGLMLSFCAPCEDIASPACQGWLGAQEASSLGFQSSCASDRLAAAVYALPLFKYACVL